MNVKNNTKEQEFNISTSSGTPIVMGQIIELNIDMDDIVFFIHKNTDPCGIGYRVSELTTGLAITTEQALTRVKAMRLAEKKLATITPEKLKERIKKQLRQLGKQCKKTPINKLV